MSRQGFLRPVFTLVLLALVLSLCLSTWPARSTTFLIPAFVLVPTLLLLTVQLVRDLRRPGGPDEPPATLIRAAGWLILMPALLAGAGLVAGGGLYTIAYYRLRGGERWLTSVVAGSLVAGVLCLLVYLLRKPQLLVSPLM